MKKLNKTKETFFSDLVLDKLESEFQVKKETYSKYSLRSYAKDLEIDPTFLSRLLSKKMRLTYKTALRLGKKLNLPIGQILNEFSTRRKMSDEIFNPISKWYYFAIIELRHHPEFSLTPHWLSSKLPISFERAKEAIDFLVSHQYIERVDNRWVFNLNTGRWDGIENINENMTLYQQDISKLGNLAIGRFRPKERGTYCLTVAANSEVLPVIREKIKNLTEEIAELCLDVKCKDEVFQFQGNFFPLTDLR